LRANGEVRKVRFVVFLMPMWCIGGLWVIA
jgi:hypothetical protein